jgi:hypothetical protein
MLNLKSNLAAIALAAALPLLAQEALKPAAPRPPMVPLAVHNPHFGIWSPGDKLTDGNTKHWTNRNQPLIGYIKIDEQVCRVIGNLPAEMPALPQVSVKVLPTRTVYAFANAEIKLTLTFMTPVLPDDLEVLARPVSYITWEVASADGKPHAVAIFLAAGAEMTVNSPNQEISASTGKLAGMAMAQAGSVAQPVLASAGDSHTIDWGYAYIAAPGPAVSACGSIAELAKTFGETGKLQPGGTVAAQPAQAGAAIAICQPLGKVTASVSCHQLLAYDELWAIQYFKKNLRPYWRRNGMEPEGLLQAAEKDYAALQKRCETFDAQFMADAEKLGGPDYAYLCCLAYRQCLAGNGLAADAKGAPLLFPKENSSNGCIATVDVIYPMAPMFLLFSPTLMKAAMVPVLDYGASELWPYNYGPHDLGTYPKANGQCYNMGERHADSTRMPVEESANLILIAAAIARIDGNADFASRYWQDLTAWAYYLQKTGFDPANQLCTDDFAGHLAHNANLSVKAILALAAYGQLAERRGDAATAAKYTTMAKEFAQRWVEVADDGDHFRLAFDKPGTWSMKYNLVWDRILGLGIFPAEVAAKEMKFYRATAMRKLGLPLDNRGAQTKTDWEIWCASLTANPDDLTFFSQRIRSFFDQVPERRAAVDWYNVDTGHMIGFTARPVIGGLFIPFLNDSALWDKYSKQDKGNPKTHIWAPLPTPPFATDIVPIAGKQKATWKMTMAAPAAGWEKPGFDDQAWKESQSGFGAANTPGAVIGTTWTTADIWLRRTVKIPANAAGDFKLRVHHDEDAEIYIDGVLAATLPGYTTEYELFDIAPEALAKIKAGAEISIAVHCHQIMGGQFIDVGIATVRK